MDFVYEFVTDCQARGLTAHTIETYRSCLNAFLQYHTEPREIKFEELREFLGGLRSRGLQGSTLKTYFAAISAFYEFMVFEGGMSSNPVPSFRKRYLRIKEQQNGENTRQLIKIKQMSQLITLAEKDILAKAIMLFLAKTGIRRGELIAMDVSDLDLENMEFRVKPKAKRSNRLGFLDHETQAIMYEYLDWREPRAIDKSLWISRHGQRVTRNRVYYLVTDYATLAGLHDPLGAMNKKFTPHCFRHFFTTHLRRAGMPREFIQELRGDRRKDAIDIYDHIDTLELKRSYLHLIPSLGIGPGKPGTLENWI